MSAATQQSWDGRRLHIIGVGGAGMSAYARAAHALGARVSGSDSADSPYLRRLQADAVLTEARIGHAVENVPAGEDVEVFFSSAIPAENPELISARERGLRVSPRAELLGELTALRRTIAVAGTHGKTTTSSMLVHALRGAGLQPSWLVGAPVGGDLANAAWCDGEWLIVEADESDRSMLSLHVEIAVLTNVELDHHASYGSLAELREAFRAFLAGAPQAVIWDRPELLALRDPQLASADGSSIPEIAGARAGTAAPQTVAYDAPLAPPAARARNGRTGAAGGDDAATAQRFRWREHEVTLAVPGAHNALNAVAALEAASLAGADPAAAIAALADFHGAGRRFQYVGRSERGALLYDDYAHHPTEVAATLRAARTLDHRRLVAVFQPHLYSRTALLAREFGAALALADIVVVLDVYPARERAADHPGVSGLLIARAATEAAPGRPVYWLPRFEDAEPALRELLGEGDRCLLMGAGDIDTLGRRLAGQAREAEQTREARQTQATARPEPPERRP